MNRAAAKAQPELTREQLELAMRQLWRPHWPQTLEAVLQHAVYGPCVRGLARQMSRDSLRSPRPVHTLPRPAAPPTPSAPPKRQRADQAAGDLFDPKRLAANDRDDRDD